MSKRSEKYRELMALRRFDEAHRLLERWVKQLIEKPPRYLSELAWPFEKLAMVYRKQKDLVKEIELLKLFVDRVGPDPIHSYEQTLIERLKQAEVLAARIVPDRGPCEMCDKLNRVLTRIDSGHLICRTCLRELSPPRPKHLATLKQIGRLRAEGLDVPDDLTKERLNHLNLVLFARGQGLEVDVNSTETEIRIKLSQVQKTFQTKVAGITHFNQNGTSRQSIIEDCALGEEIVLIREPDNSYDPRAVKVCLKRGPQIGYLKADVLGNDQGIGWCIADNMDKGISYQAKIADFYYWEERRIEMFGVILEISYRPYGGSE